MKPGILKSCKTWYAPYQLYQRGNSMGLTTLQPVDTSALVNQINVFLFDDSVHLCGIIWYRLFCMTELYLYCHLRNRVSFFCFVFLNGSRKVPVAVYLYTCSLPHPNLIMVFWHSGYQLFSTQFSTPSAPIFNFHLLVSPARSDFIISDGPTLNTGETTMNPDNTDKTLCLEGWRAEQV